MTSASESTYESNNNWQLNLMHFTWHSRAVTWLAHEGTLVNWCFELKCVDLLQEKVKM